MSDVRLSADGLYYWDGARWIPTGARPATASAGRPAPLAPARPARKPTSWTRPLQGAVAAWFGLQSALIAALAGVVAFNLAGWTNAFVLAEERAHPADALPPPGFAQDMTISFGAYFFIAFASALTVFVVSVVGALKRASSTYYIAIIALAIEASALPFTLLYAGTPVPARVAVVATSAISAVLCGVLLAAALIRGPWAMKRPSAAQE